MGVVGRGGDRRCMVWWAGAGQGMARIRHGSAGRGWGKAGLGEARSGLVWYGVAGRGSVRCG